MLNCVQAVSLDKNKNSMLNAQFSMLNNTQIEH
jgi:hypothetical protein